MRVCFTYLKVISEGEGHLVVVRRPKERRGAHEFLPCRICYGFFLRSTLSKHVSTCRLATETETPDGGCSVKGGLMLLSTFIPHNTDDKVDTVLDGLRETVANRGNDCTMMEFRLNLLSATCRCSQK